MASNTEALAHLANLSQHIGANAAYVQGGGGNISVKLSAQEMAIKASGWLLADVTASTGYSIVDYAAIIDYLKNADSDEARFNKDLQACTLTPTYRPSIETGFHALLDKYVVHSHSVFANLLTCALEGQALVTQLFAEALWIAYATPGRDITLAIQAALQKTSKMPAVLFLENHGLIVTAPTAEQVAELHTVVNARILEHFELSADAFRINVPSCDQAFMQNHVLFPDQVVYTLAGEGLLKTQAAQETLAAYHFILNTIQEKGLTPYFIQQDKAQLLLNLETEKYRQQVLKNAVY